MSKPVRLNDLFTIATTAVRPPSVLPDRALLMRVDLTFRNVGRGIKCGVGVPFHSGRLPCYNLDWDWVLKPQEY